MKIEIWSDVVCPFCYIGKRKLEKALEKVPFKHQIEIEWKSFQLNPDEKTNPEINSLEHLANSKGWTFEQAQGISAQVASMGKEQGLDFNFEKAKVANTFRAHQLIHLAKALGKGSEMKERLLKAYFSDGLNVDDTETLKKLGQEIGLDSESIENALTSEQFTNEVEQDIYEARLIGVRGVPFFVFDRKYAISGAQPDEVFDETLNKAWLDFSASQPTHLIQEGEDGDTCDFEGENC
ncbi:MAG: DsbA family oxidoreductase [Algoriphagus sp.]|uniref:DsbA family oxidoreductase n=1 Tax=Algoriphagus sp. TaxID=1872435 RepID=UPI001843CCD8|nr:DsbA family oxidoreductase [Algoriphagus sp.]NVJ86208.1 DsbA family oxidoreductase [Algoriphagus sp.]